MSQMFFGGIEGGASTSTAVIFNQNGEKLITVSGPNTNHWAVGMQECQKRICDLIEKAKQEANIPTETVLKSLGLSLSGCEGEESGNELKAGMQKNYPNLSEAYFVWSDTVAPIIVANKDGGVVLISGTGSNALLVNPDGAQVQCGGMGHLLGDEGGAYWLAVKLIKVYLAEQDNLKSPPCGYSTTAMWNCVKEHFKIETRFDLLPNFYRDFDKARIAKLTTQFAKLAAEGDLLCQWGFQSAGEYLAQSLLAIGRSADQKLLKASGGLHVACVGSVWKSWQFMKPGFVNALESANPEKCLEEVSLIKLTTDVATGATYLAAMECNYTLQRSSEKNFEVFYNFKK